ncbi:MAG: flagellar hook-basal body complex protein FliE [Woeseiaceae bacterium]
MNEISPQQLLTQIRSMNAELQAPLPGSVSGPEQSGFGDLFKDAIQQVNESQMNSSGMKRDFEMGTGDASLAEVMIATQKADLSFRAMTEVRNKLVNAYQEIMNMPV